MHSTCKQFAYKLALSSLCFLLPGCGNAELVSSPATGSSFFGVPCKNMRLVVDDQPVTVKESAFTEHALVHWAQGGGAGYAGAGVQGIYLEIAFVSPIFFPEIDDYRLYDSKGKWILAWSGTRLTRTGWDGAEDEMATRYVGFSLEGLPRLALKEVAEVRVRTAGAKELARLNQRISEKTNAGRQAERAWFLATCRYPHLRNGKQALQDALKATELAKGTFALEGWESREAVVERAYQALAAAYAETGDFEKAVEAQMAANSVLNTNYPKQLELLEKYSKRKPHRE